jgi:hypothetical protein
MLWKCDLTGSGYSIVASSWEHTIETSASTDKGEFLEQLKDYQPIKMPTFHAAS